MVEVTDVRPAVVDARGSTPLLPRTRDGAPLSVKAARVDQRDADVPFKAYRWVLYRKLDDETVSASPKRQLEVEALAGLLAARAGVRTPDVVAISTLEDGTTLLAQQGITAAGLDTVEPGRLSDGVLAALWEQAGMLHRARIAHRDLRLANVMLDSDDQPWVVDFGFAETPAPERALARDVSLRFRSCPLPVVSRRHRRASWVPGAPCRARPRQPGFAPATCLSSPVP